jgi:hypothetical protein
MNKEVNHQQKFQFFYQHLSEDIEHTKRRQWTVPYYILLLFAAIIYVYNEGLDSCVEIIFLSALALIASIFGIWHVFDVHFVQTRYRAKLHNLADDNQEFLYPYTKPDKDDLTIKYYLRPFTLFFCGIIISGFTLVLILFEVHWSIIGLLDIFLVFCCEIIYCKKAQKIIQKEPLLKEAKSPKIK